MNNYNHSHHRYHHPNRWDEPFTHHGTKPILISQPTPGPSVIYTASDPVEVVDTQNRASIPRPLPTVAVAMFPSANMFSMYLPSVYKSVQSVELLEAIIPALAVPSDQANPSSPPEPYVVMQIAELRVADTAQPRGFSGIPNSSNVQAAPGSSYNDVSSDSFAQFMLADSLQLGSPYVVWNRSTGHKAIKIFAEAQSKLVTLTIHLLCRTSGASPVAYPLPNELPGGPLSPLNNLFLRFEIRAHT